MVKRIKKRTKAQTPAPKRDRVKGSTKNPAGSASGSRGGIEIGAQATKALENMRDKHNASYKRKGRRVDLGQLKAVFRRGAGAFSVSHRPGMTRNQWALARVRTFLKLVGTGQRKKAYNTDLDLLPKDHPQYKPKAEAKTEQLQPKKYSHIDFTPPKGAQEAAARALEVRADKPESQRGMTSVGIARARDLKAGRRLSPDTVRRMLNYFTRHEVDKKGSSWPLQGKGWQAWHGWGGDAGFSWARKIVRQMNAADRKTNALRAYSELSFKYEIPDGLTVGKPFKTLALGQVSSRMSGDDVGKQITLDLLSEIVRVFNERRAQDPVVIDWQHATSPYSSGPPAPPESGNALGQIIDLELRSDGLYATPAYNERGLDVVNSAGGVLWSSPEFLSGDVYDRAGGDHVGSAQLLAITLTPRPAQSHDKIDRVTLSEKLMDDMSMDDLKAALMAKDEMVKELEAQIREMKQDAEARITSKAEHEDEEKEKMKERDENEERMAEHDEDKDKEKMREKEYNRMSEASATMLSEINSLKEQVQALQTEKLKIERDQAVKELIQSGRITPAESSAAAQAYELHKEGNDTFWSMFSERAPSGAIPLNQVGHGASGREVTRATLNAEIKKLQADRSLTYSEALDQFRSSNPDYYRQAFGA